MKSHAIGLVQSVRNRNDFICMPPMIAVHDGIHVARLPATHKQCAVRAKSHGPRVFDARGKDTDLESRRQFDRIQREIASGEECPGNQQDKSSSPPTCMHEHNRCKPITGWDGMEHKKHKKHKNCDSSCAFCACVPSPILKVLPDLDAFFGRQEHSVTGFHVERGVELRDIHDGPFETEFRR